MITGKRSLFTLTTAALLAVLTGCGAADSAPATSQGTDQAENQAQVETTQAQSDADKAQLGDTVAVGDVKVTINNLRFDRGEGEDAAADGYTYLIVDAAVENTGAEAFYSRPTIHFVVTTADGFSFDRLALPGLKGNLEMEIPAGETATGEVAFQVPLGAKGLDLIYTPDVLNQDQKAVFSLGDVQ